MLFKVKFQGPFPDILRAHILKKLDRGLPIFDNYPKNLHDLTNNELRT
jgi:hypothetical protein